VDYEDPFERVKGTKMPTGSTRPSKGLQEQAPASEAPVKGEVKEAKSAWAASRQPSSTDRTTRTESTMSEKAVGRVTPEERDEIRELFLRKNALSELFLSLAKLDAEALGKTPLYDRVLRDMGEVTEKFQAWWDAKAKAYGWESRPGGNWRIDFETCEVFLT
jgi:CXXX repeat modification system protein